MEIAIKEYDVMLNLKKGTKIVNKEDVAKLLNLKDSQKNNCLLVLQDENSKCLFFLSSLGKVASKNDCDEIIEVFMQQNEKNGLKLTNHNKQTSTDGRELDIQKYVGPDYNSISIFSCIDNHLYYSLTQCHEVNIQEALGFSVEVMQSLCSNKPTK